MSEKLKNVVEAALAAGAQSDAEAAMAMFSPEVIAHCPASLPFGGDHRGIDSYLQALAALNRYYTLDVTDSSVLATDSERVMLLLDIVYTAPTTGRSARQQCIEVLTFRGEKVSDVAVYYRDSAELLNLLQP